MSKNKPLYFIKFQKHRGDYDKKKPMHDQNLHKSLLYNTFVQTPRIEQKQMMTDQMSFITDKLVEVHHETTISISKSL